MKTFLNIYVSIPLLVLIAAAVSILFLIGYLGAQGNEPIGLWHLDETGGNIAYDSSGQGNDGTVYQAQWVDSPFGSCLLFDGDYNYVSVDDDDSLDLSNLTIVAWIKTESSDANAHMIVTKFETSSPYLGYGFRVYEGKLNFWSSAYGSWVSGSGVVSDGQWHLVAVTVEGSECKFYIDGSPDAAVTSAPPPVNDVSLIIGARGDGLRCFEGEIDEVEIYNYPLSSQEIEDIYNADNDSDGLPDSWELIYFGDLDEDASGDYDSDGLNNGNEYAQGTDPTDPDSDEDGFMDGEEFDQGNDPLDPGDYPLTIVGLWYLDEGDGGIASDSSGRENDGTLMPDYPSDSPQWTDGVYGSALSFDGANDYVEVSDNPSLDVNNLTIVAWIKTESSDANAHMIVTKFQSSDPWTGYGFRVYEGKLNFWSSAYGSWVSGSGVVGDGQWHLVAVTVEGSECKFYIDGSPDATVTSAPPPANDVPLVIGARGDGLRCFEGEIDEVEIYNYPLSSQEIEDIYNADNDSDGLPDSWELIYFGDLDEDASGDYDSDGLNNGNEYAQGTDPTDPDSDEDGFMDGEEFDQGNDPLDPGDYPLTIVGLWYLDEGDGGIASDSSGRENDGTLMPDYPSDSPQWTDGVYGSALSFDGANDYVEVSDNPSLDVNNLTIMAWVKTESSDANAHMIVTKFETSSPYLGYGFRVYEGKLNFWSSAYGSWVSGSGVVSDGQWHLVAVTVEGSECKFYIDGSPDATVTSAPPPANDVPLVIGARGDGLRCFEGEIDEVEIYNYPLSSQEIEGIYNADNDSDGLPDSWELIYFGDLDEDASGDYDSDGLNNGNEYAQGTDPTDPDSDEDGFMDGEEFDQGNDPLDPGDYPLTIVGLWYLDEGDGGIASDSSGRENDGTLMPDYPSDSPQWTDGVYGSALSFDGANDYVEVSDNPSLDVNNLTIVAWIKTESSDANAHMIVTKFETSSPYSGYGFRVYEGKLNFWSSAHGSWVSGSGVVGDGQWHLVAVTVEGSECKFYIDGSPDATVTSAPPPANDVPLVIGARGDGLRCFEGEIDEVRIYNYAIDVANWRHVIINEINFAADSTDPVIPEVGYEYIELYNRGSLPITLDRWYLRDKAAELYTFPAYEDAVTMPPLSFLVIFSSAAEGVFSEDTDLSDGSGRLIAGSSWSAFDLVNTGDAAQLFVSPLETEATIADFVYYDEHNEGDSEVDSLAVAAGIWSEGAAIDTLSASSSVGRAIYLINDGETPHEASGNDEEDLDWDQYSSDIGGSPGKRNLPPTPTPTITPTPSCTPSPTPTAKPSPPPTAPPSPSPTSTPSTTCTATPTSTPSPSPSPTLTPLPSATPSPTAIPWDGGLINNPGYESWDETGNDAYYWSWDKPDSQWLRTNDYYYEAYAGLLSREATTAGNLDQFGKTMSQGVTYFAALMVKGSGEIRIGIRYPHTSYSNYGDWMALSGDGWTLLEHQAVPSGSGDNGGLRIQVRECFEPYLTIDNAYLDDSPPFPTPTPSATPSRTPTPPPTATPTPSIPPTSTPSPTATPSPTPTPLPPANPLDVVINEIGWMGTEAASADEYIELYNTTGDAIILNGWTLQAVDGTPNISLSGTIPANGYFILERTDDTTISDIAADRIYTGGLENTGELLELKDGTGGLIDSANQSSGGWFAGEGSPNYNSMERIDSGIEGTYNWNWRNNDGCLINGLDAASNPLNASPKSLNSVFYPGPSTELDLDAGDGEVVLNWMAAEKGKYEITGYNIYRREEGGSYQDPVNPAPVDNVTYTDDTVTNGVKYYYIVKAVDTESNESNCSSNQETVTPGPPPPLGDNVIISEVMFNPEGDETLYEWIELYNPTESPIVLDLWWITDGEGKYTFPDGENLTITAGDYLVLGASQYAAGGNVDIVYNDQPTSDGDIYLSNTEDEVILYNAQSEIVDELHYYGNWIREEGRSLVRKAVMRSSDFIELQNISDRPVDLVGLKIFDGAETDSLQAYRTDQTILQPSSFGMIVNNQFYVNYSIEPGTILITCGDLSIGNGLTPLDDLILYDRDGITMVSTFTSFYGVEDPPDNTSVEKINPEGDDTESNWGICIDPSGSTTGRQNSLTP